MAESGSTKHPPAQTSFRWDEFLRGINGGYELTRVLGAAGGAAYILGALIFVGIDQAKGRLFDLTEFCLVFPPGLAAIIGAVAGGARWKDKGVATARVIEQTGAVPAPPPAGPRVPTDELDQP
jgi:hypothetical protein